MARSCAACGGSSSARLVRRLVHTRRTATGASEVQHDQTRVMPGLEHCVGHFEADIELRCRIPDRAQADRPELKSGSQPATTLPTAPVSAVFGAADDGSGPAATEQNNVVATSL